MPLSRYRKVVLFCPPVITGGPEALHQLGYSLRAIGVTCRFVYAGGNNRVIVKADRILGQPPPPHMLEAYGRYVPEFEAETPLDRDTLVILPEGMARHHVLLRDCGIAIWWLSVDNAHRALQMADLDPQAELAAIFARPGVFHLHQSAYACDWLLENGARNILELGDYTRPDFTALPALGPSPRPLASYNAAKGTEMAQGFFAAAPQFEALPLRGYTPEQLRTIFRERLLYVDFGHLPGKDRLPREAAANGCIVFLHRKGSGARYEDFPLPDVFKFVEADVASGDLLERLQAAAADPAGYWAQQANFRSLIAWEKAAFHDQVMRLWGQRRI